MANERPRGCEGRGEADWREKELGRSGNPVTREIGKRESGRFERG